MRRLGMLFVTFALATVAASCSDDAGPLFVDAVWQVRCPAMSVGGCSLVSMLRDINHVAGEEGHDLTCSVVKSSSGTTLNLRAYKGSEYGFEIQNATFPSGGGPLVGAGCRFRAREGGNDYEGVCGAGAPVAGTQPCRISDITVSDEADGPTINAKVYCINLPAPSSPATLQVDVTAAGTSPDVRMQPFDLRIVNCRGL